MAEKRLYIRIQGKVIGPFGLQQLKALRERGQFKRFHEVSLDRKRWQPASVVVEIFADETRGQVTVEEADSAPLARASAGESRPTEPSSAPSDVQWYYVTADGSQGGPVSQEHLLGLVRQGTISPSTLVWKEGMANWVAISAPESGLGQAGPSSARVASTGESGGPRGGAGRDEGLAALKVFVTDPVGGLPLLCEALGNTGALVMGFVFCIIFDFCLVLGFVLALWEFGGIEGLLGVFGIRDARAFQLGATPSSTKLTLVFGLMIVAVLPLVSLAGAIAIVRTITTGRGRIGTDVLISGACLLPLGLAFPVAVLLGVANLEVVVFLYALCECLMVLILNSGFTRVVGLSDRGAILAIPATLLLTAWLSKVIITAVILR
jgi:hypothetical protein